MDVVFNYREVPYGFAHCFRGECPQCEHCLRHMAATHSSNGESCLTIVNPAHLPEPDTPCRFYIKGEKIRVAWGIKDLYEKLPMRQARAVRDSILARYGKTHYYRIYRKECHLLPKEQEYIAQLFRRYGIPDEPAFEYYTEVYPW